MSRMWSFVIVAVLLTILASCSGGGNSPILPGSPEGNPGLTGATGQMERDASSHVLWGFWQIVLNTQTMEIEVVPLRSASFHMNVSRILDRSAIGLRYKINSLNIPTRLLDFDVTITHPVPDSNLRGFDIRGILMGPGNTVVSETDPALVYSALNGTRLLNADGYTRWWNAVEFTNAGLFGYDDSQVIPGFLIPTTTLNPYKYFSDPLDPTDPVVPGVNESNRGTFSTDGTPPSLTRNYLVHFPPVNGNPVLGFHYAIDASWTIPTGNSPTPKPIEDFPPQANCPEAFHIQVNTDNSTVWYEGAERNGGDLVLDIEVFDWQAAGNPEGIAGEISGISIESPTLCNPYYVQPMTGTQGTDATSGVYHVTIPNVHPTDVMGQEILVTVKSKWPNSYAPPFNGSNYPESAALAAYALVEVPVLEAEPEDLTLISPNGGEHWVAGQEYAIEWYVSPAVENVMILLSGDSGLHYTNSIALSTPNDGSYIWQIPGTSNIGNTYRIRIMDQENVTVRDDSDGDFTILSTGQPPVTVVNPNGGEVLVADTCALVTWSAIEDIENVRIDVSTDDGQTYDYCVIEMAPNIGEFIWNSIPEEVIGERTKVRISDADYSSVNDVSDATFFINPTGIHVESPNGGEILGVGAPCEIKWCASDSIENLKIEIIPDYPSGSPVLIVDSVPNSDKLYTWPAVPGSLIGVVNRIRISAVGNPDVFDSSDGDFEIRDKTLQIEVPNGEEIWPIASSQTISWSTTGGIPFVDVFIRLDGQPGFAEIVTGTENIGSYAIDSFEPQGIYSLPLWTSINMPACIRIESGDDPLLFDESDADFLIPINLGILSSLIQESTEGDADDDDLPDDVEAVLGTNETDRDTDHDGTFDYIEIFGFGAWDYCSLIPDADGDGIIAPLDIDDNNDGVNDGEFIDSDGDGIANYLEYYGYTYNWMLDHYNLWDGEDYIDPYYKTDPLQLSTDEDPYSDDMEVSGIGMDVSVQEPGNLPMVPGYPDIVVQLEGYTVTANDTITFSEGESITEGTSWNRQTTRSHSHTEEHNWEVGASVEFGNFSNFWLPKVNIHANYGGSISNTNSSSWSNSYGESITSEENWSRATTTNTTDAAHVKLFLKVRNMGTAVASNVIPTLTLRIGGHNIATFEPGNSQINLLEPGGIYPEAPGVYWVVDSIDTGTGVIPISLTLNELRAWECGAPVSLTMTQMAADVMQKNESGAYESVGDWNEYMARVEAVSAEIYADVGDGNFAHSYIYANDTQSSPVVTLGDAVTWALNGELIADGVFNFDYYNQDTYSVTGTNIDGWSICVDGNTFERNGFSIGIPPPEDYNLFYLVLNPDSSVFIKNARENVPEVPDGPEIWYAYYDATIGCVNSIVGDYQGIEGVWFLDRNNQERQMVLDTPGSLFYTYYPFADTENYPGGYEFNGTERIKVRNLNGVQTFAVLAGIYIPDSEPPPVPIIDNVKVEVENNNLIAHIIPVEGYPPETVTAYHPGFPDDGQEMDRISQWWLDPTAYECDMRCVVDQFNYSYLVIVATIAGGAYTFYQVQPEDLITGTTHSNSGTADVYHGWCATDEWKCPRLDFDNWASPYSRPGYEDYGDNWHQPYNTDPGWFGTTGPTDVWSRWYDVDSGDPPYHNGPCWVLIFNRPYGEYKGTTDFACISLSECKGTMLSGPGQHGFAACADGGGPCITIPMTYILLTDDNRYVKFRITSMGTYGPGGPYNRGMRFSYEFVIFDPDDDDPIHVSGDYEPWAAFGSAGFSTWSCDLDNYPDTTLLGPLSGPPWDSGNDPDSSQEIFSRWFTGTGDPDDYRWGDDAGYVLLFNGSAGRYYGVWDNITIGNIQATPMDLDHIFLTDADLSIPLDPEPSETEQYIYVMQTDEGRYTAISVEGIAPTGTVDNSTCTLLFRMKTFKIWSDW